ncbi:hypothetical protein KP509_19G028700 [Ceratopteris richardii]|uniref:Uncharacterized protein n=1 Tax=Ceratopteris richardii TaxID=49495 RepID=A0A8T2SIS0_CERRI|nr:hypothetical protein KP509_19G028700 [Ceratopteris richardii]
MEVGDRDLSVRLLVSKEKRKIIYMEVGSDVVDILLGFLQLPISSAIGLFAFSDDTDRLEPCTLFNLFRSLQKMNPSTSLVEKQELLVPPCPPLLTRLCSLSTATEMKTLSLPAMVYSCSACRSMSRVSDTSGSRCKQCGRDTMTSGITLDIAARDNASLPTKGFVQDNLIFIISDDLNIMPASTIESIMLLNKNGVKSLSDLYSIESKVSSEQVLELLKASFPRSTVLNDVFKGVVRSFSTV